MAQKSFMQAKERGNKYFVGGYSYVKLKKRQKKKVLSIFWTRVGNPAGQSFSDGSESEAWTKVELVQQLALDDGSSFLTVLTRHKAGIRQALGRL